MLPAETLNDYEHLPKEAKQQVVDFIEFMKSKYKTTSTPVSSDSQLASKGSFHSIHVTRSVSLEEMDEAIADGASRL
uniref:DUF2281 domain-containing protein n=1 Tax=uncultured Thiotrichaceae bacterium TaxID=298394 RepID=A0A6S6UGQ7_9GAMM|nr:MAG: Unknown protein [uncultured Thiotrichaceae bacterium]